MDRDFDWIKKMEAEMRRWADESLSSMLGKSRVGEGLWSPRVDIYETNVSVVVRVCAAGVTPADIDISLTADGRQLTVRGVRRDDADAKDMAVRYHQIEVYVGPFERVISLPPDVRIDRDRINAIAKDGFFIVNLPKLPVEQSRPRTVPISQE